MVKLFKALLNSSIAMLFPHSCVGCGALFQLLCPRCFQLLTFFDRADTQLLITQLTRNESTYPFTSLQVACHYTGVARKLLFAYKYQGIIDFGAVIGNILYYTLSLPRLNCVTYVPLHPRKRALRGFNQTQILAEVIAAKLRVPCLPLILKTKHTNSQMSLLDHEARKENSAAVFAPRPLDQNTLAANFDRGSVLLVDDVITTGATLIACASVLQKLGFQEIHGIVFAHGH